MAPFLFTLILKSTVVLGLAGFITALLGRASSAVRHLVWLAGLGAIVLMPAAILLVPEWRPAKTIRLQGGASVPTTIIIDVIAGESSGKLPLLNLASGIYLAGALLLLLRASVAQIRAARLARRSTDYDRLEQVPVRLSREVDVPLVCGLGAPAILLPEQVRDWPRNRLRVVLAHELMHVRRRDTWAMAVAQCACALYWPHPLVWWAAARMRSECERACDDGVLAGGEKASAYAEHLMEIVRGMQQPRPIIQGGITMIRIEELQHRLTTLLNPHASRRSVGPRLAALAACAALVVLVPLAALRAPAQVSGSTMTGVVRDASGATVPRAQVIVSQSGTSRKEFAITNDTGEFSFTPLPDGFYKVEVRKPGFALYEAGEIALKASAPVKVDVVLNIGRIQESMNVSAERVSPVTAANAQQGTVPKRIRVGGNVQASKLSYQEKPLYPADCKAERVEGTVMLTAVISREGVPINLEQVNQLVDARLVKAATDAVRQWRYQPTLLNGEPVEIVSQIQVNFTLTQ
ncbi:MAG: TonB family protein [Acidobacteriia bacterium]|nr:TonB family protein [Terriglobia bacterium]